MNPCDTATERDIISTCSHLGPPVIGEDRSALGAGTAVATILAIELLAGAAAEKVLYPNVPTIMSRDRSEAFALCMASSFAPDAMLAFCRGEARAIIRQNRDVLQSLTDALVAKGTLDGDEVDVVIMRVIGERARQAEHARRADWRKRCENAKQFSFEHRQEKA